MATRSLQAAPLTRENFAEFGEVIETHEQHHIACNQARFDRYMNLANVDTKDAPYTNISLMVCRLPSNLPMDVPLLERHPHGSQAFFPTQPFRFVCVLAPPAPQPDFAAAQAFVSNGHQGINMRRGVWHMPMIGFGRGQTFIVIDCGHTDNCDEVVLNGELRLESL